MKGHSFSIIKFCTIHISCILKKYFSISSVWKKQPNPQAITLPRTRIQFSSLGETAAADMVYAISLCKWDLDHWENYSWGCKLHPYGSFPSWFEFNSFSRVASAGNWLPYTQDPTPPNVRWLWLKGYWLHSSSRNASFHTLESAINSNSWVTLAVWEVLGDPKCPSAIKVGVHWEPALTHPPAPPHCCSAPSASVSPARVWSHRQSEGAALASTKVAAPSVTHSRCTDTATLEQSVNSFPFYTST